MSTRAVQEAISRGSEVRLRMPNRGRGRLNQQNRLFRPLLAVLALPLVAFAATDASADNKNPSPEEIAAARDLDREGVKLARTGNCADAVPKLERARELYEAPVIPAVALGDCLIRLGKIV